MPHVEIVAGDRKFQVGCTEDELAAVTNAAAMLNEELAKLAETDRGMAPSRMFMLAGLQIADNSSRTTANSGNQSAADRELVEKLDRMVELAEDLAGNIDTLAAENCDPTEA